jgi:hypothetical protein
MGTTLSHLMLGLVCVRLSVVGVLSDHPAPWLRRRIEFTPPLFGWLKTLRLNSLTSMTEEAKEWRRRLSDPGKEPADIQHGIKMLPIWYQKFNRMKQLGLIMVVIALKFGCCQDVFVEHFISQTSLPDAAKTTFAAATKTVLWVHKHPDVYANWVADVGGPLYSHGFLIYMNLFGVICSPDDAPRTHEHFVELGKPPSRYALLPYSPKAAEAINSFLNLHDTLAAVFAYPPPSTLEEWDRTAGIIISAMKHRKTVNLGGGHSNEYVVPWQVRYLLVAYMRMGKIMSLEIPRATLLSALPGPDLGNKRKEMIRLSGYATALQVFAFFGYTGAPEMFCCCLCLFAPVIERCFAILKRPASSSRSRTKRRVKGFHLRVNDVPFQTKSQFLKNNGYSNTELTKYKQVMGTTLRQVDTLVIEGATDISYSRSLPANWLNGAVDVAKESVITPLAAGAGVPKVTDRVRAGNHMEMYRVSALEAVANKKRRS